MNADAVAEPGILSQGRIARSSFRMAERPVFGLIIAIIASMISIAAFTFSGQLQLLETEVNDQLRVVLPHHAAEQDKRISIVTLTEETLIQFPYRSPVDRGFLAELLTVLNEVGVKGVVFDVLFDQPTEVEKDAALIAAMKAFDGPIVAAWGNEDAGLIKEQSDYLQAFAAETGIRMGFANVVTDADGVVRHFVTRLEGIEQLSMSGAIAKEINGETPMVEGVIDWAIPAAGGATVFQEIPGHRVTQFAKLPGMMPRLKAWLGGRIIFVGADLEQRDRHQTSMAVDVLQERTIPGVLIQAHVLAQLLDNRIVPNATETTIYLIVAVMALAGVVLGLSRWILIWKAASATGFVLSYLAMVILLAQNQVLFMPVAPALTALFLATTMGISLESFLTQRDERFIRRAFSHYLEPAMVDQLAEDPQALRLGGDRREMSFVFTDIQGFTTMSEELPPDQLTRLLNDYFDGMSDIIIEHGGAIDKFIGDAVVAHFGAPTPMADHALHALKCSEKLDIFAEKFRLKNAHLGLGVTRIGVHSGVATVGNFGGRARFDYTAMGDAVNTAARLESSNKRYGTRVGVSQETAEMAGAMAGSGERLPLLQTIGQVNLKGKSKPVTVYTINTDAEEEFVWAYEAAFSLIDVDLERAKKALTELFRNNPNDPLVKWHLDRLKDGGTGIIIGAA